jgi:predicted dehydrogenase
VKFLIAGLGSIGRRHLRNLVALGEENIVLYRTGKSTLPEGELERFPTEYTLEDALKHKPDAVIVSNPTALHLDVAIPAAQAGCHLLIEKPLSHSMERVKELHDAVHAGGGKVLIGFQFRYDPGLLRIKEWIDTDEIGTPVSVQSWWGEYLPGWHPWEDFQGTYAARDDLGGGVVLTLCHPFDYLRWIFGNVESVNARVDQVGSWNIPVEDHVNTLLDFKSGLQGFVHLDYIQRPPEHNLKILGTRGTILWDNADSTAQLYKADDKDWLNIPPHEGFERNDLFIEELKHFLRVINQDEAARCDLADGIEVLRIVEGIKASSERREYVVLTDLSNPTSTLDE